MPSLPSFILTTCLAATLALSGCTSTAATTPKAAESITESLTLNLKTDEFLQFVLIREREGEAAKEARKVYFETAIPFAASLGDKYLGTLKINKTLLGKNNPRGMAIYSFPNEEAQKEFQATPNWPTYKRLRREGWEELHVFSTVIPNDMEIVFDPSKDYTLAAAWTKPDTFSDYERYLAGIESDFDKIGARYVAQLGDISLQSHSDDATSQPSQLTLVEWSDSPNLPGLQKTDAYKDHAVYFQNAVSRFDLYWLSVPQK